MTVKHPAKFTDTILREFVQIIADYGLSGTIVDPFGGVGLIHELGAGEGLHTIAVELEPEWAEQHVHTLVGDSTDLVAVLRDQMPGLGKVQGIFTSPAYGNRMADSYAGDAKGSRRSTYRIALDRPLSDNNGAGMQFGHEYKRLHYRVWKQCWELLDDGGLMVVNVKNFIRAGEVVDVVGWHLQTLERIGFTLLEQRHVDTPGMRMGANRDLRVDGEEILVMTGVPF